ncbi:exopolysaccharide biosynthesis polyprenyl glycosylphosphotransferase [Pusillimonas sp. ANT_WB101]|uniref:exopolysaccharide biosynthesis polyprenyl glycosylphosphotransferase n=1 Tax=Pusillimonas sp. ANT_WB101 TaxID=2597356 RepID=UPI00165DC3A5|nr:exopolysaccharide biosynthesis polyprenyl glycosylphosphotransferase [Pusillimonas sp. ANT_WB101]
MSTQGQRTALAVTTLSFVTCHFAVERLRRAYPGGRSGFFIAPQVIIIYMLLALIVLLMRADISRLILVTSGVFALIWFYLEYLITSPYRRPKLALVGSGVTSNLLTIADLDVRIIKDFNLGSVRYDAVVADFENLDEATERFLTQCALRRIAVYDAKRIFESFTGRVRINQMSENNIGSLLPSISYERIKFAMDIAIVLLTLPIVLPVCVITALLIKIESPGPIIFTQQRVGLGNKIFTIYKFRSMRFDGVVTQQFADEEDPRITRVGRVIRKMRIDELPQFINVLKNQMSIIGPRPEQPEFVARFDTLIPFYSYRHVVKPGITGWAQVRQGYTADADATRIKIEYDFYYIKNCSIYLDILVVFLTVKIMLTGFGAR